MIDINELRKKITIKGLDVVADTDILKLLDRLEAAEKERDDVAQQLVQSEIGKREISKAHNDVTRRLSVLADENIALRAKIETTENDAAHQKALADSALRVVEGWERKCDELRAALQHESDCVEAGKTMIEALRAKIERMEKQESAGKFIQHPSNGLWEQDGYGDNPDARPLYLAPGAQAQPAPSVSAGALQPVVNWLRNGCDPQEAAKELELLIAAAPEAKP